MHKLLFLLGLETLVNTTLSYNILLVFPHPARSHAILGEGYVRHLLQAGHEVTYITPFPLNAQHNLKQVDISSEIAEFQKDLQVLDFKSLLVGAQIKSDIWCLYDITLTVNNRSLHHKDVQKFLLESNEKYDVAIIQWLYSELNIGFAAALGIPYIWASSYEHHPMMLSFIDELQNPVSFRNHFTRVSNPLTLTQRFHEIWHLAYELLNRWVLKGKSEIAFKEAYGAAAEKRGITLPTLEEFTYKSSLMFGNAHVSVGEANKLPQNYIPIGGFHIDNQLKPLPENFQKLMDEAQDGVIYFSMGSLTKSSSMPEDMKQKLLMMFGELKQTIIWKYEEDLKDIPKNVHIVQWAPQQSILAHRNCRLFITHGGLLSILESLHYEVPIIGIPLFIDHFVNIMRAVNKGFGLEVNLGYDMTGKLKIAIQDMLSNPKYREKMKEFSFIYHHRPIKPGAALIHWVEHVIKTKGAAHLQSPALHVPFHQKVYLDLLLILAIGTVILIWIINNILSILKKQY